MLKNVSYNNPKQEDEINNFVGKPFSLIERLKMKGIGSGKLLIVSASKEIENLLILDQNINQCNIERRPKGILIYFRVLLETYALIIPYYKLVIFKVDSDVYTIHIDHRKVKIKVKGNKDHEFFRNILNEKANLKI
tara:strand:+ start:1000 stop:1407 length:408 start_codon:yes stop_codon:yes gene_type:complete